MVFSDFVFNFILYQSTAAVVTAEVCFFLIGEICINPQKELLIREKHLVNLCYRLKGSSKRISYQHMKWGLIKKQINIEEALMPF